MRTFFKFKLPAVVGKSNVYIVTATATATATAAVAALTISLNPNSLSSLNHSTPLNTSIFSHNITTALNGVVRSSRALFTITSNVVDYKYSLRGLSAGSDEYRRTVTEVYKNWCRVKQTGALLIYLAMVHLRSASRILKLCEANKGFYVKAGQFVAALRQVPKEYSSTLASLQDQAVPCDYKAIKEILISNLGPDFSEIFLSFDEQPIAAASIAQVHRALLKDHQEVAVKVQYPGLEDQMKLDVRTMSLLSKSVTWFFPDYRFQWMVSEFAEAIALELDFIQEAKNSARTAKNFENNKKVKVPCVFWELTTSQVLTMQFCKGRKVDDLEFMKEMRIDPKKVAKVLVEVFAEMIFVHGFLHGDPHPGNILVSSEGKEGFSLVLLDHGIYKTFDDKFRLNYCQLWKALILQDSKKIQQLGEHFGAGKYARYFPLIFTGRTIDSKSALGRGMSVEEKQNLKQEVKSLTMEDISTFMEALPSEFLTVLRTDGLLRSLISKLGSSQKVRLLVYAKYAFQGLSTKWNPESDFVLDAYTRFKWTTSYFQLRISLELLELLSWLMDTRKWFIAIYKQTIISVNHLLVLVGGLPCQS